jgi:hypothetical protein
MPHKARLALEELDRRLTHKLNDTRVTFDDKEKDPRKRVVRAHFTISSTDIHPPLSITDIWKHCMKERFIYTRSVSIRKHGQIDIYVRR